MQIVSGDITGEIVYLKAYKQMVGEVTGYSTEKGTATVKLCDTGLEITVSLDDIESTGSTQPHRAFNSEVHILGTRYSIRIRSVRGGVEHGSRIIKAGIYSLYHSGSRIIGSRYTLV